MLKKIIAVLLLSAAVSPVFAGTFKLPEDKPNCTITVPASWKPSSYTNPVSGIQAETADGTVYFAAEAVDTENVEKQMADGMKWFVKNGVTVDDSTMTTDKEFKLNGVTGVLIHWSGKDKEGPCLLEMLILPTAGEKGIAVYYWASPEGDKKHSDELIDILHSIKTVE